MASLICFILGFFLALIGGIVLLVGFFTAATNPHRSRKLWTGLALVVIAALLVLAGFLLDFKNFPVATTDESETMLITKIEDQVVYQDLRNGDQTMYSVTVVRPVASGFKTLIVVTEPGMAMDIIYPSMIFSSYMLEGTQAEILRFVEDLGIKSPVKVYIGNEIPRGYTTVEKATGWWDSLTTRTYTGTHIDSGKAVPQFIPAGATLEMRTIRPGVGEFDHGQFWIATQPGQVVHYEVASGYQLTIMEGYQGTNFHYSLILPTLQDTVLQASTHVVEQDHVWKVVMLYCGNPANVPGTILDVYYVTDAGVTVPVYAEWQTSLSGWTCEQVGQ